MHLTHRVEGSWLLVDLEGDFDLHSADYFRQAIEEALNHSKCNKLVLNLAGVSFLDSSGLGVILGRYRRLKEQNGEMYIAQATPSVKSVLQLSGIMKLIPVYDSVTQVLTK